MTTCASDALNHTHPPNSESSTRAMKISSWLPTYPTMTVALATAAQFTAAVPLQRCIVQQNTDGTTTTFTRTSCRARSARKACVGCAHIVASVGWRTWPWSQAHRSRVHARAPITTHNNNIVYIVRCMVILYLWLINDPRAGSDQKPAETADLRSTRYAAFLSYLGLNIT